MKNLESNFIQSETNVFIVQINDYHEISITFGFIFHKTKKTVKKHITDTPKMEMR